MSFEPKDFRSEAQKTKLLQSQIKKLEERMIDFDKFREEASKNIELVNETTGIVVDKTTGIIRPPVKIQQRVSQVSQTAPPTPGYGGIVDIVGTSGVVPEKKVIIPYTWAITGTLSLSSYAASVVVRNTYTGSGYSIVGKIVSASFQIGSGTNLTWKLQKNGSDLSGYGTSASPLTATTTAALVQSTQVLADQDILTPVPVGVSGSPTNFNLTVHLEYTI